MRLQNRTLSDRLWDFTARAASEVAAGRVATGADVGAYFDDSPPRCRVISRSDGVDTGATGTSYLAVLRMLTLFLGFLPMSTVLPVWIPFINPSKISIFLDPFATRLPFVVFGRFVYFQIGEDTRMIGDSRPIDARDRP